MRRYGLPSSGPTVLCVSEGAAAAPCSLKDATDAPQDVESHSPPTSSSLVRCGFSIGPPAVEKTAQSHASNPKALLVHSMPCGGGVAPPNADAQECTTLSDIPETQPATLCLCHI